MYPPKHFNLYLQSRADHLQEIFTNIEVGDYNSPNNLQNYSTQTAVMDTEVFAITHNRTQLVEKPTSKQKNARVQPIPKQGHSHRLIKQLIWCPFVSEVIEKDINIYLINYLQHVNIISNRYYGFRSRRSTGILHNISC